MYDDGWEVFNYLMPTLSDEHWNKLHEILSSGTVEEIAFDFTYEYFKQYCYLPGSGFCFNKEYVYFNGTPRLIDKVHSEESFFQQSTVHDFYDLTFEEIMILKEIYEFLIGEFP